MATIGVIGGYETNSAVRFLDGIYAGAGKTADIFILDQSSTYADRVFDIIIINSDKPFDNILSGISLSNENIFIVNADFKNIFRHFYALNFKFNYNIKGRLITYGFNPKSCVTASSIAGDEHRILQLCIQRSIPTFSGRPVDEQEFPVDMGNEHRQINAVLGAVTAALVDGIEVDSISNSSRLCQCI